MRIRGLPPLSLLLLPAAAIPAQNSETQTQFWPEVDAYVHLNAKARLLFQYSATRRDDLHTYAEGQAAGFLDIYGLPALQSFDRMHSDKSKNKLLMFRAGYVFSKTPASSGKVTTEHTPTFLADLRFHLPFKLVVSERNRGDLRYINGVFTPRYRNRVKVERGFRTGRFELAPYGMAEAFYDWRYDAFNRYRYTGGGEWTLNRHIILDASYVRQRDTKSKPEFVNAIAAKLYVYFR